jgi:SAM-dependent methyltransferase
MSTWHNESGKPLSSVAWLEAHHQAKLIERTEFAQRIAARHPRTIVDLGCGPGIWLDLLNEQVDRSCEIAGLDADECAIKNATDRSSSWSRKSAFKCIDIETEAHKIPEADVYLAFNIFPYLNNISSFIEILKSKVKPNGCIVIRQYDGALLRFGPMDPADRLDIEISLQASVLHSEQFKHYDLDRVFEAIQTSTFLHKEVEFEVFKRVSPYPPEFLPYLENTINWTLDLISEQAAIRLRNWITRHRDTNFTLPSYFSGTDLVAWLS